MNLYTLYMEYTKPFKGSRRYHSWAILSGIAALMERRTWISLGGLGQVHPNMYVCLCGNPGTGKTTVSNLVCDLIKEHNERVGKGAEIKFGPDKTTPAALFKRFKTTTKIIRGIPGTKDFDQSAMYLHSTEFATLIKDIGGGSLSDDLLKFYDCDKFFEKELSGDGIYLVKGPCLNLIGDTTPQFLSGFLPREESGTGLTARIIFATEVGEVEMDHSVPAGDPALKERIINEMARIHRMGGEFTIEAEAQKFWVEWWPVYRKEMFALNGGSFMRYFYARKPIHVRKVAMALSASRSSDRIIKVEDFRNALAIIEEAEPYMEKSFGVQDFPKMADATKQILDSIPYAPLEVTKAELIQKLFTSGVSGKLADFESMVKMLQEGQLITTRTGDGQKIFYSRVK